jgi:O-antigen/teichoic acid export membrane protein
LSPLIADFFSEPVLRKMLPQVGLIFIISSIGLQFEALIRKNLLFDLFSKINIFASFLSLLITIALALSGFGVWALIYGQIGLHIIKTFFLVIVGYKKKWFPEFFFSFAEIKEHFYFGLHRVGAMVANQFNSRVDQIAIGSLLGPISLGFYNVAFRIVLQPIQRINPILTQVAFPVFSQIQNDNERLKRGYLKMVHLLMSINAPVLIGICSVAPVAVPLLLGDQWSDSVPIVQILAFYTLIRSLGNAGGSLIMAKGKANWTFYWNIALLGIIPVAVILAVYIKESVLFVAFVLVILQIFLLMAHYHFFLKRLLGGFALTYTIAILKPVSAASCMGFLVYMVQPYIASITSILALNLVFSIFLGATVYIGASYFIQRDIFLEYKEILPVRMKKIFV